MSRSTPLITGMSGTGKSTTLHALGRGGHRVVDTDDPEWIIGARTAAATDHPEPQRDLRRCSAQGEISARVLQRQSEA